jgi:hypothetical protein
MTTSRSTHDSPSPHQLQFHLASSYVRNFDRYKHLLVLCLDDFTPEENQHLESQVLFFEPLLLSMWLSNGMFHNAP